MKRLAWRLALALLLVAYDVYLFEFQRSAVQGNVEAQFIIITPAILLKHWADVRDRRRQRAERVQAQAGMNGRLDVQDRAQAAHARELAAHRADLAEHRKDLAVVAAQVGEMHEAQATGRLPKRYRPYSGEPPQA